MAEQVARRAAPNLGREILALGALAFGVLVVLSLASFDDRDISPDVAEAQNLIGPVGAYIAHGLYAAFGYAAYLLVGALFLSAAFSFFRWPSFGTHRTIGGLLLLPTLALVLHLALAMRPEDVAGGALGEALGEGLRAVLNTTGAWVVAVALTLLCLLLATPVTLADLGRAAKRGALSTHQWCTVRWARVQRRRALARERRESTLAKLREKERVREEKRAVDAAIEDAGAKKKTKVRALLPAADNEATQNIAPALDGPAADDPEALSASPLDGPLTLKAKKRAVASKLNDPTRAGASAALSERTLELSDDDVLDAVDTNVDEELSPTLRARAARAPKASPSNGSDAAGPSNGLAAPDADEEVLPFDPDPPVDAPATSKRATPPPAPPKIVEPTARERIIEEPQQQRLFTAPTEQRDWTRPSLDVLEYDAASQITFNKEDLMRMAERLTKALADFRVEGRVVEIHPGPVVTMYEFELAAGTKVKQVQSLEDDLAMALQAVKVRITTIPGKGVLGIEVANREREIVYFKEIVGSEKFHKTQSRIPLALGKDISGQAVVTDLAKMPHLLVAGTTGSGKSVGLNSMLISFLYASTPEDVRIILVDQKTTEFGPYDGLPHLLLPVVVDPKRAAVALRWAVEEMERRYGLMSELGVRHILGYNKRVEQMKANGESFPADEPMDGEEPQPPRPVERMPYIVIMIDELADLMMVAPREVEGSLQRLAQMARASGIHIIIATQRPSVDVVSGVIRANFPARIAFQTRTRTDSRTILDDGGAEQLLGQGDMLLLPPGTSTLQRVHGAFVSDAEVKRVCDHWRAQGKPNYDPSILTVKSDDPEAAADDEPADENYDAAIAIVAETRQVSISMIQRRLRVGYNRAARMVERMERDGIIGPNLGPNQPREIYASPQG